MTEIIAEPARQEIVITRVFDAPRELVYRAYTDPDLIRRWWGPRRYETVVDTLEVRPGGRWRFLNREADGTEHGFHGVIHDAVAPERIVMTFEYEGAPGHVALDTAVLTDAGDGRTRVTATSVFQSLEDRDAMVASGMEGGARETYDRLEELLKTL
ncbi:MAG TPA: SRPBCC family protein [Mycobacteriales bacterium]|nr:SRPBCC family protein [Mycobacteriales bacterium]